MIRATKCANCGENLREGAKFCQACGAPASDALIPQAGQAEGTKEAVPRRRLPLVLAGVGAALVIIVVFFVMGTGRQEKPDQPQAPSSQIAKGWKPDVQPGGAQTSPTRPPESKRGWRPDPPAATSGLGEKEKSGVSEGKTAEVAEAKPPTQSATGWKPDGTPAGTGSPSPLKSEAPSGWRPEAPAKQTSLTPPQDKPESGGGPDRQAAKVPAVTPEAPNPAASARHNEEGMKLAQAGQFQAAAQSFSQAVKADPANVSVWNNLGLAQRKQGKIDEALKAYREALRIQPDFALTYKNLGVALEQKGQKKEAGQAYLKYCQLAPQADDAASVKKRADKLLKAKRR